MATADWLLKDQKISFLGGREPDPDDPPYRPAPIPNPGQPPWPGYPKPKELADLQIKKGGVDEEGTQYPMPVIQGGEGIDPGIGPSHEQFKNQLKFGNPGQLAHDPNSGWGRGPLTEQEKAILNSIFPGAVKRLNDLKSNPKASIGDEQLIAMGKKYGGEWGPEDEIVLRAIQTGALKVSEDNLNRLLQKKKESGL